MITLSFHKSSESVGQYNECRVIKIVFLSIVVAESESESAKCCTTIDSITVKQFSLY